MTSDCIPGDFLIFRIDQPVLSDELIVFLQEYRPVGIHFGKNAFLTNADYNVWLSAFRELRDAIRHAIGRDRIIWALDHEGGRVVRTPPPITRFPYPMNWQSMSHLVGYAMGMELESLGINLLFGPSLDSPIDAQSGVIGPRAFACNPADVIKHSQSFLASLKTHGIQAAVKHFPGHGGTSCDSHFDLPSLDMTYNELASRDMLPFTQAQANGTDCVMFAHILFRSIDAKHPASLSHIFHQQILRGKLNFDGVTITDDLDMKSIAENYSAADIAKSVIENEINFMIFNHSIDHAARVMDKLAKIIPEQANKSATISHRSSTFIHQLADNDITQLPASKLLDHESLARQIGESYQVSIRDFDGD